MAEVTAPTTDEIVKKAIQEGQKQQKAKRPRARTQPISAVGLVVGLVVMFGSLFIAKGMVIPGIILGLLLMLSIKICNQWEKAVVLRLGKLQAIRGAGPFLVIPFVDSVSKFIDHRAIVTDVQAETAITKDTVPVDVDAIVFWMVWDAEKAVFEVQDYYEAVILSAQTALRESIGRHMLAETITERESLGKELRRILDEKTTPWGITVQSVEIKEVRLPPPLQEAMSRQAQAERERQARIILGTAETEIAEKFAKASELYQDNPVALHLRAMNMLYEALKEKGSMVIVPSSAVETMGLGGLAGITSLSGGAPHPQSSHKRG
jgi:regulator of protease activity HflC (stomatin/prohibitin superfamily)